MLPAPEPPAAAVATNGNARALNVLFVIAVVSTAILAILFALDMRSRVSSLEVWRLQHELGKEADHAVMLRRIEALEHK